MKRIRLLINGITVGGALMAASSAQAQPSMGAPNADAARPADISAVSACVQRAEDLAALKACSEVVSKLCLAQPGGESTAGMVTCMDRSRGAWDRALNNAYAQLMRQESPTQRQALRTAQRAWIAWRDAGCSYDASVYEGGSLARVVGAGCVADATTERAIALIARLRGPEFN